MKKSILKVGTPADYAPFSYINETSGKYEGFDIDIIKHVSKELGLESQFVKTTWSSISCDLTANKFTLAIGGISLTTKRKQDFLTSIPTISDAKTLLIYKKHADKIKSLSDADNAQYTLIANYGGTNEKFARKNIKKAKLIIVDDNMAIFEKIANGVVDAMVTDLSEAMYKQSLDDRLMVVEPVKLYTQPIGYGFLYNKGQDSLKNTIDVILGKFMLSEQFKTLCDKYALSDCSNLI